MRRTQRSREPFLLLIGGSGSGKSSLLRAGILPRMVTPGAIPEVDLWRKAVVTPGPDPFLSLAESLFVDEALGADLKSGTFRSKELLAKQLAGDPDTAIAPLRDALDRAAQRRQFEAKFQAPRPARLALGVDQAERLLIESDAALAARFANLLQAMTSQGVAYVIMALRSDAYPRFQAFQTLVALRDSGATFDLLPPTPAELEEIVTRPVALCAPPLKFEQKAGRSLAALLVADARGGDALPLLQMTLSRIEAAEVGRGDGLLRFADYHGMDAAVTQTANEALDLLDETARAQLPVLVMGLVRDVAADPATGATISTIGALDRQAFEGESPARKALLDAFIAKRLLTAEGDASSQRIRPTHEALLRIWPQAVAIIAETGDLIRVRHTLQPIVREWSEAPTASKARHLDISPALLDGAQRLLDRFATEIPRAMRDFIAASSAEATARQQHEKAEQEQRLRDAQAIAAANRRIARRTGLGLVAALALAALAGWQWKTADAAKHEAQTQRDRAEHSVALATETANGLIFDIAQKFRNVTGVPTGMIKDVLDRARKLQDQLIEAGESSPALRASQAAAFNETAVTLLALGASDEALSLARQSKELFATNVSAMPGEISSKSNLATTENIIGNILKARGDLAGAVKSYQESLAVIGDLAASHKDEAVYMRDLSLGHELIAEVYETQGNLGAALTAYRDGLVLAKALADKDPGKVLLQRDLAVGQGNVGDILKLQGDLTGALGAYREGLAISTRIAAQEPNDSDCNATCPWRTSRLATR